MSSFSNKLSILISGIISGMILFQTAIVAPVVFRSLDGIDARRFLRSVFPKLFLSTLILGGLSLVQTFLLKSYSTIQLTVSTLTIILMGIFTYLITKTDLGRAQRACEQDRTMTALLGINVDRTISITFIIGSSLASVAGMMFVLYYGVIDFYIGFLAGIKAFTAAVLGGIGSLPGAMLGGLLIGLIETMWSGYVSIEYKDVAAFSVLIITLIFFPTGFLGKPDIEKV